VNILVLWGVEIEHMLNFDETWVSVYHVVQENEKPGIKTANINTKNLRSFITGKAHCSVTHIKQRKSFDFCPSIAHGCHYGVGSSSEYCHNVGHGKTRMVVYDAAGGERTKCNDN